MTSLKFSPASCATLSLLALVLPGCFFAGSQPSLATTPSEPTLCSTKLAGEYETLRLDLSHEGRSIPTTLFTPKRPGSYPVIGFSHGAFAAPERYSAMLGPLAASGFVVIAPMHIDSEEMERETPPTPQETWSTRNQDMRLALSVPEAVSDALPQGVEITAESAIALGHSFGALMAQFAGGAQPIAEDGSRTDHRVETVRGVVAFSPPGPLPDRVDGESWARIAVPSLTLTGSADILPGFIDDWTLHKASYENAPAGTAQLWTGEGVDHYFGGMFGRVKPADATSQAMFGRAMAQSLGFIERTLGYPQPCDPGETISGESHAKN